MIIPLFPTSTTFRDESATAVLPQVSLKLIAPPANPLLTNLEAYQQLRLDNSLGVSPPSRPDDSLITAAVVACNDEIDAKNGWLGRALITQQWQYSLRRFPQGPIVIPFPPLQSIDSVSYEATIDGTRTVMVEGTDYRLGDEDDTWTYIRPMWGARWPRIREENGSVQILFTCGYGDDGADVPELIRQYARMRLGFYYENRETTVLERGVNVQSEFGSIPGMLENFRVRGIFRPWDPAGANG